MIYKFIAYGHPNILGTHKTTLEFTKDDKVSLSGDCILGIKADFNLSELKDFIKKSKNKKIMITIETEDKRFQERMTAQLNPEFSDDKELVIRKTDFISKRTFATGSDKAAFDLDRELIRFLKKKWNNIIIFIEDK